MCIYKVAIDNIKTFPVWQNYPHQSQQPKMNSKIDFRVKKCVPTQSAISKMPPPPPFPPRKLFPYPKDAITKKRDHIIKKCLELYKNNPYRKY